MIVIFLFFLLQLSCPIKGHDPIIRRWKVERSGRNFRFRRCCVSRSKITSIRAHCRFRDRSERGHRTTFLLVLLRFHPIRSSSLSKIFFLSNYPIIYPISPSPRFSSSNGSEYKDQLEYNAFEQLIWIIENKEKFVPRFRWFRRNRLALFF